jgi:hypothetical protein
MDLNESRNRHVYKSYPAALCERSTEPSVSIKDGEYLVSRTTDSFLWKDYAARISLVKLFVVQCVHFQLYRGMDVAGKLSG